MQRSKLILDGLNCPPHLFAFKMEAYWMVESELNLFTSNLISLDLSQSNRNFLINCYRYMLHMANLL